MKFVENVEKGRYEKFVRGHEKGHFLQSWAWGETAKLNGLVPFRVGVEKKGKLVATAQLLEKKLPLGQAYFYVPRGFVMDYDDRELLRFMTEKVAEFARKRRALYFRIDPDIKLRTIDKNAKEVEGENNFALVRELKKLGYRQGKMNLYFENAQPRFTFRVKVDDGMEEIRARYSESARRYIREAEKYGVEARIGTREELEDFIELMKMTEKRQGFFSHEDDFYRKMYDLFRKEDAVSLMIAKVRKDKLIEVTEAKIEACKSEQKKQRLEQDLAFYRSLKKDEYVVSGYINVHYGDKSWYLYGANDMRFRDAYGNYKLFDFQIEQAHEMGKAIFDEFGTIGEPNSGRKERGLHEFKRKFGGEYTEFIGEFTYVLRPVLYTIFEKVVPVYRKVGKKVRRLRAKKG